MPPYNHQYQQQQWPENMKDELKAGSSEAKWLRSKPFISRAMFVQV